MLLRPVQIQCLLFLFLHLGAEELGPLRAMKTTSAGLSLALNLHWKGTDFSATLLRVSF
jgi:hypothetical protein